MALRVSTKTAYWLLIALVSAIAVVPAAPAVAQSPQELPTEFSSGDKSYPTFVYVGLRASGSPGTALFPNEGFSGATYREKPLGAPSWGVMLQEYGFNSYMIDFPDCGRAPRPRLDHFTRILERTIYGTYAASLGAIAEISFAHGTAAAFTLKARSWNPITARTMIFIDPIGPQHSQPLEPMTVAEVLAAREGQADTLWREWGFGPQVGELYDGLDIDLATAEAVLADYEYDQPAYKAALLSTIDSPIQIREPIKLLGLPVLVVRTPAADARQIAREEAFTQWMRERGMLVETMDLRTMPEFAGITGLPWIGEHAAPILQYFVDWYQRAKLGVVNHSVTQ